MKEINDPFRLSKAEMYITAILLTAVSIACIALFIKGGKETVTAQIIYNSEIITEFSLNQNQIMILDAIPTITFEVKDGAVAFIESDCPDKVCIHAGYLSRPGQSAACLPNKTILRINGGGGVDLMAR